MSEHDLTIHIDPATADFHLVRADGFSIGAAFDNGVKGSAKENAYRWAAAKRMEEALKALGASENGELCWCPPSWDEPFHIFACIAAKRALAAAVPAPVDHLAGAAADGRGADGGPTT